MASGVTVFLSTSCGGTSLNSPTLEDPVIGFTSSLVSVSSAVVVLFWPGWSAVVVLFWPGWTNMAGSVNDSSINGVLLLRNPADEKHLKIERFQNGDPH